MKKTKTKASQKKESRFEKYQALYKSGMAAEVTIDKIANRAFIFTELYGMIEYNFNEMVESIAEGDFELLSENGITLDPEKIFTIFV